MRGKRQRKRERIVLGGQNRNHNYDLKNLLQGATVSAMERPPAAAGFYAALAEKGMRPSMARLTPEPEIAAIT